MIASSLQRVRFLEKYSTQLDAKVKDCLRNSRIEIGSLSARAHQEAVVPTLEELKRVSALLTEEREALAVKQQELVRAAQRRRSLESLRDKKALDFKVNESRRQQKAIDGLTGLMETRRRDREPRS